MENISKDFWWLNDESQAVLNRGYLLKGEDVESALKRIINASCEYLPQDVDWLDNYKKSLLEYISKGYLSLSSPIWANMGTQRGLPISCFGVNIGDSIESITYKLGEVSMQTKVGGGTSGYFGNLRGRGTSITDNGTSNGSVAFMRPFDTIIDTISQGGVRKGAFAAYLDIDHPDIEEFLQIRDIGNKIQNLLTGVCVPDYWLQEMIDGDVEKREIWAKVLESRQQKGIPYILFTDNVNRNKPEIYKKLDLTISHSNLCSEISLPDSEDESFICCLASLNLALYDEWKNTDIVKIATIFLDTIISDFIKKSENRFGLKQVHNFAKRHRAIGLGVMGLHSYYQSKMIAFDDPLNVARNEKIFKDIKEKSYETSKYIGEILGYAPIFNEVEDIEKMRNTTLLAIAPTTSSSAILGQVSPGIEPYSSNYYKAGLAKGNFIRKNKYLEKLLEEKNKNNMEIWNSIMLHQGSVQHLDFLTQEEKDVFKTFSEINQHSIIEQASARQKYIDQSQSLNINIPSEIPIKDVNRLILDAWKLGVKTLYYQRSKSVAKEMISNLVTCSSCEA